VNKQISIIGCGWLGLPLAQHLIDKNFKVKGSTTSSKKLAVIKEHAIEGYVVRLTENKILGNYAAFLADSETVIINIPPGLRHHPNKNHVAEIKHLVTAIENHNIKHVLYISSTSVFNDSTNFPQVTAITPPDAKSNTAQQLIEIEQTLQNNSNFSTTILRFGGLFDETRHPAKYLSGKTQISNPEAPLNLIHKKDCIQIIEAILKNQVCNVALNAVYPNHPAKQTYYSAYCERQNLPLPEFDYSSKSKGKIINSSRLVALLNYTFKHVP
jgi:nucleoside-diphosphate-sugar epimerase